MKIITSDKVFVFIENTGYKGKITEIVFSENFKVYIKYPKVVYFKKALLRIKLLFLIIRLIVSKNKEIKLRKRKDCIILESGEEIRIDFVNGKTVPVKGKIPIYLLKTKFDKIISAFVSQCGHDHSDKNDMDSSTISTYTDLDGFYHEAYSWVCPGCKNLFLQDTCILQGRRYNSIGIVKYNPKIHLNRGVRLYTSTYSEFEEKNKQK